jgi:uncharacterized repeat protein (TIGR03803 family)
MPGKSCFRKRSAALALLFFGVLLGATSAQTEAVLYSFCPQGGACADGASPYAGVVFDQKGNLYGTTFHGGDHAAGVVFRLTPKGKETVLHSFCAQNNCADGANPYAGLVFDQKGNLYGTTELGGSSSCNTGYGCGVLLKLRP